MDRLMEAKGETAFVGHVMLLCPFCGGGNFREANDPFGRKGQLFKVGRKSDGDLWKVGIVKGLLLSVPLTTNVVCTAYEASEAARTASRTHRVEFDYRTAEAITPEASPRKDIWA